MALKTTQLGQILTWKWQRPGVVCFRLDGACATVHRAVQRMMHSLCLLLLANYPHSLLRPTEMTHVRPVNAETKQHHSWHVSEVDRIDRFDATIRAGTHVARTLKEAERHSTTDVGTAVLVQFLPQLAFSRYVQLWSNSGPRNMTRYRYE